MSEKWAPSRRQVLKQAGIWTGIAALNATAFGTIASRLLISDSAQEPDPSDPATYAVQPLAVVDAALSNYKPVGLSALIKRSNEQLLSQQFQRLRMRPVPLPFVTRSFDQTGPSPYLMDVIEPAVNRPFAARADDLDPNVVLSAIVVTRRPYGPEPVLVGRAARPVSITLARPADLERNDWPTSVALADDPASTFFHENVHRIAGYFNCISGDDVVANCSPHSPNPSDVLSVNTTAGFPLMVDPDNIWYDRLLKMHVLMDGPPNVTETLDVARAQIPNPRTDLGVMTTGCYPVIDGNGPNHVITGYVHKWERGALAYVNGRAQVLLGPTHAEWVRKGAEDTLGLPSSPPSIRTRNGLATVTQRFTSGASLVNDVSPSVAHSLQAATIGR